MENIKTEAFIAGMTTLYEVARAYPNFRMIPISRLDGVREGLTRLGYSYRTRYRGPHGRQRDTLKRNARAFTLYFRDPK
jgi:hypothetical protein